jgi:leucine dehydrogenase
MVKPVYVALNNSQSCFDLSFGVNRMTTEVNKMIETLKQQGKVSSGPLTVERIDLTHHLEFDNHHAIYKITDPSVSLTAFVGVHHIGRGPAMGGTRLWPYTSEDLAITDVLRLSKGMTYKSALAGLPLGGGKAVIMASPTQKTPALLTSYATALNWIGGEYLTAADVNTNQKDMDVIRDTTPYVSGVSEIRGGRGDPSDATAQGVFHALVSTVQQKFGKTTLSGLTVAIQGLGSVGFDLAQQLKNSGCQLIVADINENRIKQAVDELGAQVTSVDLIHSTNCDVFAPCALGAILNEKSIAEIKAGAICGAANNQLKEKADGGRLAQKGILYAPDYAANSGGIIKVCAEYLNWDQPKVSQMVSEIGQTMLRVYEVSASQKVRPEESADMLARDAFMKI